MAAADAVGAASEIGFPVAVKARHRHVGRSVRAGVALDLADPTTSRPSIDVMRDELGDDADFVVVQTMAPPGLDLRIRATVDDEAGAVISLGIGGIQAGLVGDDDPRRLAPLSVDSATSLVAESRAGPALTHAGIDPAAVIDVLIRAAQLIADHAEITVLDLNPVITTGAGCYVTDAVVTLAPVGRSAGCAAPDLVSGAADSAEQLLADAVEELAAQAERVDVDALVVAVEALAERLERDARREQRGTVCHRTTLAVEPRVRAADDQARDELGSG